MMPFELDYYGRQPGTMDKNILAKAKTFINDPYKAPEQKEQAADYIRRYEEQ